MIGTGREIVAKEGVKGLATGFGSTAVGYFGQGGLKFALNDFFKLQFARSAGGAEKAVEHRMAIYLGAAA
jgi:solute carrier family 25 phosphate transporter 3